MTYRIAIKIIFHLILFCFFENTYSSSIAILSITSGEDYIKACHFATLSKQLYANQHGYDYFHYNHITDVSRPPAWSKISMILEFLPKYDWIVWIDGDAMITNNKIKLESFLSTNKDLIIARFPDSIEFPGHLNSGIMFIKNSKAMKDFFSDISNSSEYNFHPWWEQAAIINYYRNHPKDFEIHVECVHPRKLNSMPPCNTAFPTCTWEEGDFILHTAGVGISRRKEIFEHFFNVVRKNYKR